MFWFVRFVVVSGQAAFGFLGSIAAVVAFGESCQISFMHPFPHPAELQFLVGKELSQIALDPHSVQFRWTDGGQIAVTGELEHVDEAGDTHTYDCTAHTGPALLLHRLIQKKVTALKVEPLCLTLAFNDGQQLRLKTEEGPWECGLIQFTDDLADGWIVY